MGSNSENRGAAGRVGAENYNWKGGRLVAGNGYVIVRVGKGHHLADVRGYAYEHRIVAEKILGRQLKDGEVVLHRNRDKQDNRLENLEILPSKGHFFGKYWRKPSPTRDAIIAALRDGPLHFTVIASRSSRSLSGVKRAVYEMAKAGIIRRVGPGVFALPEAL